MFVIVRSRIPFTSDIPILAIETLTKVRSGSVGDSTCSSIEWSWMPPNRSFGESASTFFEIGVHALLGFKNTIKKVSANFNDEKRVQEMYDNLIMLGDWNCGNYDDRFLAMSIWAWYCAKNTPFM